MPYKDHNDYAGVIFELIRNKVPPAVGPTDQFGPDEYLHRSSAVGGDAIPNDVMVNTRCGISRLWDIFEECWLRDPSSRPRASHLRAALQDEARKAFIVTAVETWEQLEESY